MAKKNFLKRRRNDLIYALLLTLFFTAQRIPRKLGLFFFGIVGRLFYAIPTREKKWTSQHLSLIFGKTWSADRIKKTARSVYINLGKNIFDGIYLSHCSDKRFKELVTSSGFEGMMEASAKGQGFVAITGHTGCFEMMIQLLARNGIKCVTIGQRLYDPRVDTLTTKIRKQNDIVYLHRDGSGRDIIRLLKKGYALGVLVDQDTNLDGVFARFLGLPAYTPSGPMRLGMTLKVPVFMGYSFRQPDNTHHITIEGPLVLEKTDDTTRDLVFNMQKVNDFLCEGIMKNPEQWVWMHRRWRKKPDDEACRGVPNIESYKT